MDIFLSHYLNVLSLHPHNGFLGDLGVRRIVTEHRFLGGLLAGDSADQQSFVMQKVLQWSNHVRTLAIVASVYSPKLSILLLPNHYNLNGCFL